ncbi:MAG: response regulator [Chloroflexota bacterium]
MPYILLVEDNQDNADLVIRILEPAGFEIHHVVKGLDAAPAAKAHRPDLILLDFNLPDIDGRNLILTLKRQLGREKAPPIVAVTARTGQIDEMIAERFGCVAFVRKPFDPAEFLALVLRLAPVNQPDSSSIKVNNG